MRQATSPLTMKTMMMRKMKIQIPRKLKAMRQSAMMQVMMQATQQYEQQARANNQARWMSSLRIPLTQLALEHSAG